MREFLKGWKRKFGIVTLLVSCLFCAAWIRGFFVQDVWQPAIGVLEGNHRVDMIQYVLKSSAFGITWEKLEGLNGTKFGWQPGWGTDPATPIDEMENKVIGDITWRWRLGGFDFCDSQRIDLLHTRRRIPYWPIVLSLTALSAYLLLSKPRTPRPSSEFRHPRTQLNLVVRKSRSERDRPVQSVGTESNETPNRDDILSVTISSPVISRDCRTTADNGPGSDKAANQT